MANGEWEQKRRRSHRNAAAQKDDHSFGQTDSRLVIQSLWGKELGNQEDWSIGEALSVKTVLSK